MLSSFVFQQTIASETGNSDPHVPVNRAQRRKVSHYLTLTMGRRHVKAFQTAMRAKPRIPNVPAHWLDPSIRLMTAQVDDVYKRRCTSIWIS